MLELLVLFVLSVLMLARVTLFCMAAGAPAELRAHGRGNAGVNLPDFCFFARGCLDMFAVNWKIV